MSAAPRNKSAANDTTLALVCLGHLEQEEAMLEATIESLKLVRAALIAGDLNSLAAALDRQEHTARAAEELKISRAALRTGLAEALGAPVKSVTLAMLAARITGDTSRRLADCRARLQRMAADVDRFNRGNAALVNHSLEFLRRFLIEITGGVHDATSYGRAGNLRAAHCGFLIEGRG